MTGPALENYILNNGLTMFTQQATDMVICSGEPSLYSLTTAGAANQLGRKAFGAGNAWSAPASGTPNGQQVAATQVTDGTITTSGTAAWWAAVDVTNSRLHAHGSLSATQAVTAGNTFTLGTFNIRIPSQ
jgi:hypothetical protein